MRLVRYSLMILRSLVVSFALCAPAAACTVDLDISCHTGEVTEDDPGAVVVRHHDGNGAARKKIILRWNEYTGDVILGRNVTLVKVFDALTGGSEITFNGTDNKFSRPGDGVKDLFVQGDAGSGSMKDVILSLKRDGEGTADDDVKFTVLWVIVTTDHTGSMEDDNAARGNYSKMLVPQSPAAYTCGHHLFATYGVPDGVVFVDEMMHHGRGSEFMGNVAPSNFAPSQFGGAMLLTRAINGGYLYWGGVPNGSGNPGYFPPGEESILEGYRDNDPQSGESEGVIYDIDGPGVLVYNAPDDTICRIRLNFEEWAEYDPDGEEGEEEAERCSEKVEWYTRQSYKKTGSWDYGTASSGTATTLTDTKSWTVDVWKPGAIMIHSGTGADQVRHVTSNTATTITVSQAWGTTPDDTSVYEVINTSTWTLIEDCDNGLNDNESGDGTTPTTWDLE